jgi:hypothetical protein
MRQPKRRPLEGQVTVTGDIATVNLTRGEVAIIDAEDAERVKKYLWSLLPSGHHLYGYHHSMGLLHRFALGLPRCRDRDQVVDHINDNGLDCRKANLRTCTNLENVRNSRKIAPASSTYKGVVRDRGGWRVDGKAIYLSSSPHEPSAALVYDEAARERFGYFARLNFPEVA